MIPLMMQQDYKPQGWRKLQYYHQDLRLFFNVIVMLLTWDPSAVVGLILGTRMW